MEMLNIAVVGCGLIGKEHIKRVQQSSRTRLSAIVDPTASSVDYAKEIGSPHFESLQALFSDHTPDGVILATPNHLHFSQALDCIEADVAVLIEKPLADKLSDAEQLCAKSEQAGARVLVGHHRAHSPIMAEAARAIDQGLLGRIVAVQGSATFYKPDHYFDAAPWRKQPGGGPILINLIHEIGNLRKLCGEISELEAMGSQAIRGFEVEDTAAILLRFESGALGTFILSDVAASPRSWEQTSQENPSYSTYSDEDCYLISGTKGSLSIPTMRVKRFVDEEPSWWSALECSTLDLERKDPLVLQLDHFCDVITGKAQPIVSAFDGMQNLKVIDAVQRSIQLGGVVKV